MPLSRVGLYLAIPMGLGLVAKVRFDTKNDGCFTEDDAFRTKNDGFRTKNGGLCTKDCRQHNRILAARAWRAVDQAEVSFEWKNPDFVFKNPDFLLKSVDFKIKQEVSHCHLSGADLQLHGGVHGGENTLRCVKYDEFCIFKTRNYVLKTRNFVLKMMNSAVAAVCHSLLVITPPRALIIIY